MKENKIVMAIEAANKEDNDKSRDVFLERLVDAYLNDVTVYAAVEDLEDGTRIFLSIDGEFGTEMVVLADLEYELEIPFRAMTFREVLNWVDKHRVDGIAFCNGAENFSKKLCDSELSYEFIRDIIDEANKIIGMTF